MYYPCFILPFLLPKAISSCSVRNHYWTTMRAVLSSFSCTLFFFVPFLSKWNNSRIFWGQFWQRSWWSLNLFSDNWNFLCLNYILLWILQFRNTNWCYTILRKSESSNINALFTECKLCQVSLFMSLLILQIPQSP